MLRFEHYFKKILPIALTLPICLCGCANSASPETSTTEEQSVSALKSQTITNIYEDGNKDSYSITYDYSKKDNQYIVENAYDYDGSSEQNTDYYDSNNNLVKSTVDSEMLDGEYRDYTETVYEYDSDNNLVKEIIDTYDNYTGYDDTSSDNELELYMRQTYHYYVDENGNNVEDKFEEISDGESQRSISIKIPDTDDLLEAMYYYYDDNSKKKEFESGKYDKEEAEDHEINTYDEYGIITDHKYISNSEVLETTSVDISEESGTRTYTYTTTDKYTDMSIMATSKSETIASIENGKARIIEKIDYDYDGNPERYKEYDENGNLISIKKEDSSSFTRTANMTYEDNKLRHYECTFEKPDEAEDGEIKTIDISYDNGHISSINECMVNGDVETITFSYDSDQLTSIIDKTTNKDGEVLVQQNRTYEYADINFPAEIISKANKKLNLLGDFEFSDEDTLTEIVDSYVKTDD